METTEQRARIATDAGPFIPLHRHLHRIAIPAIPTDRQAERGGMIALFDKQIIYYDLRRGFIRSAFFRIRARLYDVPS